MTINEAFGKNLNALRNASGLSMGALADRTGLSKAAISQIEQGKGNPTISTVSKLAEALKVPYTRLLEPQAAPAEAIFEDDAALTVFENGAYRRRCYYPFTPTRGFELVKVSMDPGCEHRPVPQAPTESYLIVLGGMLIVEVGEFTFFLMEGDAISFSSEENCVIRNDGDDKASFICATRFTRS